MSSAPFCTACGATIPADATECPVCHAPAMPAGPVAAPAPSTGAPRTSAGAPEVDDEAPMQAELRAQLEEASLGEYDIIGELGRGGMATVYLAHEIALDRKVAIKVMSPAVMLSPKMAERFKREARTAAALSHPNIVPIYAVRETDRLVYFVMKCLMGRPPSRRAPRSAGAWISSTTPWPMDGVPGAAGGRSVESSESGAGGGDESHRGGGRRGP